MRDKEIQDFLDDIEQLDDEKIAEHKKTFSQHKPKKSNNDDKGLFKEIDLHGDNVLTAQQRLVEFIYHAFENNPKVSILHLRIITGKGRHSKDGKGKLIDEIYRFVKSHFKHRIAEIDEPPAELILNNLPIRGHFEVKIKRK